MFDHRRLFMQRLRASWCWCLQLFRVVLGLAAFVLSEADSTDHDQVRARPRRPALIAHAARKRRAIFARHLAGDLARPRAIAADEPRAAFHYFSPAAGNTGQMSTGMSFSCASTPRISAVSTPYLFSSALARLKSPVASIVSSSV